MSIRVRVYRNLNNGLLSIQSTGGKLILAHCKSIRLVDAKFLVSEKGRQRVIANSRKDVHAYVEGFVAQVEGLVSYRGRTMPKVRGIESEACNLTRCVRYNPYQSANFTDERGDPVYMAPEILIHASGQMRIPD